MSGDFNCHHPVWYGPATRDYAELIHNASTRSEALLQSAETYDLSLHNKAGVFTYFPRNGTRPSIVDLTWSRFQNGLLFSSWLAPADAGHGSDHTSTYAILNIARPTYTPRRRFVKCNWSLLSDTIKAAEPPGPPSSPEQALEFGTFVQKRLENAIDKSVPWFSPGKRSAPWWNIPLSVLRRRLAWAERQARRTPVPVGAAETLLSLGCDFKTAI